MLRTRSVLVAAVLLTMVVTVPRGYPVARAQTLVATPAACSGPAQSTPMSGHYTGPWHSDGEYHFSAFGRDIDLKLTIDGTLDATVTPDGRLSGTVQGTVDAPVSHEGQHDVSSGHGTISGQLNGVFSAPGSLVVLAHPAILMHWGTFVGGGYTEDRTIIMPDYQFPVSAGACVTASGTISETGFPMQNIVDDANGSLVQIPGVGSATGTWQLSSDAASRFNGLSGQVDALLGQGTSLLTGGTPVPYSQLDTQFIEPLKQLESTIRADPTVARCLLDRIAAWEVATLPELYQRAAVTPGDLPSLRQGIDLLRTARALNLDCGLSEGAASATLDASAGVLIDRAVDAGDWAGVALLWREAMLLDGTGTALQARIDADLHAHAANATLDTLRAAYVLGDIPDAQALYEALASQAAPGADMRARSAKRPPHKHHHHKRHVTTPKPTPTATATPSPTATASRPTMQTMLVRGITEVKAEAATSALSHFSWQALSGASRYMLTVTSDTDHSLLWAWSGGATESTYGDTTLEGVAGSANDGWPLSLPANGWHWSVLALDGQGRIVGAAFNVSP